MELRDSLPGPLWSICVDQAEPLPMNRLADDQLGEAHATTF
jgi:hypothetical protein